ncbi:MAG: hypothetical protein R2716_01880 [Microthrixaceae bacterium]
MGLRGGPPGVGRRGPGRWAPRLRAADVELLVDATVIGESMGVGLAEVFEGVAATLLDRGDLQDEIRALASQASASVVVLCCLPVLGLVMLGVLSPGRCGCSSPLPSGWGASRQRSCWTPQPCSWPVA